MADVGDIERLFDGLCRRRGVFCAVRPIAAFDNRETIHQQALAELVGGERQQFEKLRSPKRKAEFCAGRIAARAVLTESFFGLQSQSVEIIRDPLGAPRLVGYGDIHLSITHCEQFAVAVAATFHVGVDLERDEPRPDAFLHYFMEGSERATLKHLGPNERQNAANQFWCRKEAACKVGGWGATLELGRLDCSKSSTTVHGRTIHLVSDSSAGFVASLAYESPVHYEPSREAARDSDLARSYG